MTEYKHSHPDNMSYIIHFLHKNRGYIKKFQLQDPYINPIRYHDKMILGFAASAVVGAVCKIRCYFFASVTMWITLRYISDRIMFTWNLTNFLIVSYIKIYPPEEPFLKNSAIPRKKKYWRDIFDEFQIFNNRLLVTFCYLPVFSIYNFGYFK